MKINRGWIFIAIIATVIIATAGVGKASPTTITLNPSEVKDIDPGGTFNVDVTVDDVSNLFAWQVLLHFDPDVLQVDNVTEGPFLAATGELTDFILLINNTAGYVIAGGLFQPPSPEFGASGDGVLATMLFSVIGRGTVTLEFDEDEDYTNLKEIKWTDYQATPPSGYTKVISHNLVNGAFTNGGGGLQLGLSLPLIIAIVVVVALCGVGAFYFMRRRRA